MQNLKSKTYNLKPSEGFTLIEIIIASAVIAIVSIITVVKVGTGNQEQALLRSAQKLALDLRRAQNLALSPLTTDNCVYGVTGKTTSSDSYILYVATSTCDSFSDRSFPNTGSYSVCNVDDGCLGRYEFEDGVVLQTGNNFDISFLPPEPISLSNGRTAGPPGSAFNPGGIETITIRLANNIAREKKVVVNKFGNIEIQ
ncbi:MAG: prepilin-type N-terminal cleavage/methylation domain-containing protein [Patescibacteria group bacterium]